MTCRQRHSRSRMTWFQDRAASPPTLRKCGWLVGVGLEFHPRIHSRADSTMKRWYSYLSCQRLTERPAVCLTPSMIR